MDDQHRKQFGVRGEDAALEFLTARKLQLIERNYRCRGGEIDLVMLDGGTLALIEVRYRANSNFGGAAASVTWHKQRRIICASRHLLLTRAALRHYPARFDVIAVSPASEGVEIEWIRAAFSM
ncbi:MAG: YraN family protein [Povalibacter sp.]